MNHVADDITQAFEYGYKKGKHDTIRDCNISAWIPVTERLPECNLGAEVGNIEWISCGMVHAGCFGRGGKYRDAYFRTWTDAGEGMDAKDADYWRAVTLPEPPKDELIAKQEEDAEIFMGSTNYGDKVRYDEAMNAVANIVNAPTVIEASEVE